MSQCGLHSCTRFDSHTHRLEHPKCVNCLPILPLLMWNVQSHHRSGTIVSCQFQNHFWDALFSTPWLLSLPIHQMLAHLILQIMESLQWQCRLVVVLGSRELMVCNEACRIPETKQFRIAVRPKFGWTWYHWFCWTNRWLGTICNWWALGCQQFWLASRKCYQFLEVHRQCKTEFLSFRSFHCNWCFVRTCSSQMKCRPKT